MLLALPIYTSAMAASSPPSHVVTVALFFLLSISATQPGANAEASAVTRFREYLRIPTVHPEPDYKPVADWLLNQGNEVGLQVELHELSPGKHMVLMSWIGTEPALPSIQLNSHVDVVPAEADKWIYHPFSAEKTENGDIFARGSQDMKCVGMQYLEAVRNLKHAGFVPRRTIHITFVPDEEIGGATGVGELVKSPLFSRMNVGVLLDEGLASPTDKYRIFYAERGPWWLVIKSEGAPGHGSKVCDGTAAENLLKSVDVIMKFRASQFDMVKAGEKEAGDTIGISVSFLKAGTPTPTGYVMNLQPSVASAGFDIRLPPFVDPVSLERRIAEEWAPAARNMTYSFVHKVSPLNNKGAPMVTATDISNPWWDLLTNAVATSGKGLERPEIFPAATDARFHRHLCIPAIGFSPMSHTEVLLHDHNEYLNEKEFLKGIEVYEEIIRAYSGYNGEPKHEEL